MGLGVFFLGTAEHFIWVSMTLMPLVVGSFLLFLGNYIKNGNHLFETILQTIVNSPNPIVSVAGGTEVTITGTGLAGVTGVTIGGLPAIVVSKTDTTVVVQVPVSTKTGLADLTITNDKGSVTAPSAIIYTTNPVIKITKTRTITGFKAGQRVLTASQQAAVRALITANPTLTTLSCAARTTGVRASKTELARTRTLATATCTFAKRLKPSLVVSSTATQTLPKSKAARTVVLTFKN
jgi:hypothetical protein